MPAWKRTFCLPYHFKHLSCKRRTNYLFDFDLEDIGIFSIIFPVFVVFSFTYSRKVLLKQCIFLISIFLKISNYLAQTSHKYDPMIV